MAERFTFDRAYYDRYYRDPATRVASQAAIDRLVAFVAAYLAHIEQPVETVLDLGCGTGMWRKPLRRQLGAIHYQGVEVSPYLCREYGWEPGSAVDWRGEEPFDLVVCQGVLQYLDARQARRAIANLAANAGGALYLEALTREDWQRNCDRERTDGNVYLRPAAWYREALDRYFHNCGGGLYLSPASPAVLYELEWVRAANST